MTRFRTLSRVAQIAIVTAALLLAACGPAPTAAPIALLPTATSTLSPYGGPTLTVAPSIMPPLDTTVTPVETPPETATHTATPTASPSAMPTHPEPTVTKPPTARPTPTATERPRRVIFQRDFDTGQLDIAKGTAGHWNVLHEDGVRIEIIPDPTKSNGPNGRPRGSVMKATIRGGPVQHLDWGSSLWWRNGYPDWTYGYPVQLVQAPCAIQVDVYKSPDLTDVGLLGVHRINVRTEDRISVSGFEIYGDNLVLVVRDGEGRDQRVSLRHGIWKPQAWNTLRLVFEQDGTVLPYVNGQLAYEKSSDTLRVPVDADHPAGFVDGHAGIIWANDNKASGPKEGQYLLNDNFVVLEYR